MPGNEHVDVKLPSGETITAIVPQGASDEQVHSLLQQKHPEFFAGKSQSAPQAASPQPQGVGVGAGPVTWGDIPKSVPTVLDKFWEQIKGAASGVGRTATALASQSPMSGPSGEMIGLTSDMAESRRQAVQDWQNNQSVERPDYSLGNLASRATIEIPGIGPALYGAGKEASQSKHPIASAAGSSLGMAIATKATPQELSEAFQTAKGVYAARELGISETASNILDKSADALQRKLGDAHALVSAKVGRLVKNLSDVEASKGIEPVQTAEVWQGINDISKSYKATLPKFSAALDAIENRPDTMSIGDLIGLRQEVGRLWRATKEGTPDASALGDLYTRMDKIASDRAGELGASKQYAAYKTLWSTLKEYEGNGVLGEINRAQGPGKGLAVFKALRDVKNQAQLREVADGLQDYGISWDDLKSLRDAHGPLYNVVADASGSGSLSKIRAISKHPVVAGIGYLAGRAGGGYMGGVGGAVGGASLMDKIAAARAIADMDVPQISSPMREAGRVQELPVSEQSAPQSFAAPQNSMADLVSALRGMGFDKQSARTAAVSGLRANPGDFDAALRTALKQRGGTVR